MPTEDSVTVEKPPYLSLTTLTNFFDKLGQGPVPPRIDPSTLDTYSGGTQALLKSTLKQMGYIDAEGGTLPALRQAAVDEVARKSYLAEWARRYYTMQLDLAEQNATAQMLQESFAGYGYNGSTLRKAVVFYLALVEYLGLPTSPHFKAPKQSATPTAGRRRKPPSVSGAERPPGVPLVSPLIPPPRGEQTIVRIGDLATITITVDAQWMKLPVETITTMRGAVAQLEALATPESL